ncbi:MAG: hypothetical protein JXJ04_00945, partial [Spirochaetales bacterium]|nr:hypothetical protein [Spirochaetales bacterium]
FIGYFFFFLKKVAADILLHGRFFFHEMEEYVCKTCLCGAILLTTIHVCSSYKKKDLNSNILYKKNIDKFE